MFQRLYYLSFIWLFLQNAIPAKCLREILNFLFSTMNQMVAGQDSIQQTVRFFSEMETVPRNNHPRNLLRNISRKSFRFFCSHHMKVKSERKSLQSGYHLICQKSHIFLSQYETFGFFMVSCFFKVQVPICP